MRSKSSTPKRSNVIPFPVRKNAPEADALRPAEELAAHVGRRLEVFEMTGDTLSKFGIKSGDEFAVEVDKYSPGHYHILDEGARGFRVARIYSRPPNLVGLVLLPSGEERRPRPADVLARALRMKARREGSTGDGPPDGEWPEYISSLT